MIDLPPFTPKSVAVPVPDKVAGGKYRLGAMAVGDAVFHYGVTPGMVSPYCVYQKKFGQKFRVHKASRDNRDGVTIVRVK